MRENFENGSFSFNQIYSWTENTVPILLAFYIGSLSDQYGRLPFLALCMMGKLTGSFFNLLNAIYLDSWSRSQIIKAIKNPSRPLQIFLDGFGWEQCCRYKTSPEDSWRSSWWRTASSPTTRLRGRGWSGSACAASAGKWQGLSPIQ